MFDSNYAVYLADTAQSRSLHHQVRYQVFCLERGFEKAEQYPNQEERDLWDLHSRHFVVKSHASDAGVAAVRLVLPTADQLPVEHMDCITEALPDGVSRNQVAEASRICVVRENEQPNREQTVPFPSISNLPLEAVSRSNESEVLLGMIRTVFSYSRHNSITHMFMLVTKAFARLLKRLGVVCTQMGEGVEHRGLRIPHLIDVNQSWDKMASTDGAIGSLFARDNLSYLSHARETLDKARTEADVRVPRKHLARTHNPADIFPSSVFAG